MISGHPPSELAVSNDLSIEPEVRVDIKVALEDPNVLVIGLVEHVYDSPNPQSLSEARALEVAVTDVVAAVLCDVPSAQPVVSMVSEQSPQTALLIQGTFASWWSSRCLRACWLHHGF